MDPCPDELDIQRSDTCIVLQFLSYQYFIVVKIQYFPFIAHSFLPSLLHEIWLCTYYEHVSDNMHNTVSNKRQFSSPPPKKSTGGLKYSLTLPLHSGEWNILIL